MRRCFHNQLQILWDQIPLKDFKILLTPVTSPGGISLIHSIGAFTFIPLVSEHIHLIADLKITMLRPEPPGRVINQSGDIDNRLKTLFDSLRMPANQEELPAGDVPTTDETPFFCLLEDDNLITSVSVVTDRWLNSKANMNDVLLVVHVTTRATRVIYKNIGLG